MKVVMSDRSERLAGGPSEPPHHKHRRSPRKSRRIALLAVGLLLLGSLGVAYWAWNRPLGRTLEPETIGSPNRQSAAGVEPQCGGPPVMMILLVGKDLTTQTPGDPNDYDQGFADAIRLIRVDFVTGQVSMVAIPRDLWVPIPGLQEYGIESNRLKLAYAYGYTYFSNDYGPILLAQTLTEDFGVSLDHYAAVSLQAVVNGIDAIGGIDITLVEPLDLRNGNGDGYYFSAGKNHLDGEATVAFARARPDNSSDLYRIARQTEIIQAVQNRLLQPDVLPTLPRLAQSMRTSVLTDLSPAHISMLVCLAREMDGSDIVNLTLPESSFTPIRDQFGYQAFLPDFETITAYLADFELGNLPEQR